jgi:hypothetical protein
MSLTAFRMLAAIAGLGLALAGCESSSRLRSLLPEDGQRQTARGAPPAPLTPAPSADVDTTDLPPPPGAATAPPPVAGLPQGGVGTAPGAPLGGAGQGLPGASAQPGAATPAPSGGYFPGSPSQTGTGTAGAVAAAPVPAAPAGAPTRTAVIGNWSLAESAGGRCRITLSSAPKLDLYGAGTSGCQSKDLQRVNAWELNGSEVILYEPGGGVVARLRQSGGQSFSGAVAKTGAPISISK